MNSAGPGSKTCSPACRRRFLKVRGGQFEIDRQWIEGGRPVRPLRRGRRERQGGAPDLRIRTPVTVKNQLDGAPGVAEMTSYLMVQNSRR